MRPLLKVDKVDEHDNIVDKIHMEGPKTMKLRLGFVAVRNRTPKELAQHIKLEDCEDRRRGFPVASSPSEA